MRMVFSAFRDFSTAVKFWILSFEFWINCRHKKLSSYDNTRQRLTDKYRINLLPFSFNSQFKTYNWFPHPHTSHLMPQTSHFTPVPWRTLIPYCFAPPPICIVTFSWIITPHTSHLKSKILTQLKRSFKSNVWNV